MKIKSLELINVKSHEHTKMELSKNITLLIGANNSGKSTVIRALFNLQYHSFTKSDIRTLAPYAKTYVSISEVAEIDKKNFESNNNKQNSEGSDYVVLWGVSNGENHSDEILFYNSKRKVERMNNNTVRIYYDNGNEAPLLPFLRFSDNEQLNNYIYPFLAKRKTDHYDSNVGKDQTFKVSDTLRNLAAKIIKLNNGSTKKSRKFDELCEEILGFRIGVIPMEGNNGGNEPGIYSINSTMIPIRSMGEGVANIIGFIVILLTENNKLFLIEELENDIHPKALKKLLELITDKSNSNQFVISTHSNIVLKYLGAVPDSKIFYFDWKPTIEINGEEENIPTSSVIEVENKPEERIAILEKLGYDFFDFEFYLAYLILEESSAETIIRDFIIPNYVPELYGKIKTIAANGVEDLEVRVAGFGRLFVFIHSSPAYFMKAWVIADGDPSGKKCIKALQKGFKTWPSEHFLNFTKDCFEEYYPDRFQIDVQKVLGMPHGQGKQEAKKELLMQVMSWALENRAQAIKEFEESFAEVIGVLRNINSALQTG